MLHKLSQVDWNHFQDHLDWGFVSKTPSTKEEKKAKYAKILRRSGFLPNKVEDAIDILLGEYGSQQLKTNSLSSAVFSTQVRNNEIKNLPLFRNELQDGFFFTTLRGFTDHIRRDPTSRNCVVDLKLEPSLDGFAREYKLNTTILSLPSWLDDLVLQRWHEGGSNTYEGVSAPGRIGLYLKLPSRSSGRVSFSS